MAIDNREPKVLIIILNYRTANLTIDLIDSLSDLEYSNFQIMVIDNNSPDDSVKIIKEDAQKKGYLFYANTNNSGYAAGNNIGIRYGIKNGYKYSWILNSDVIILDKGVLRSLVDSAESDEHIGGVGPKIITTKNIPCAPYCHRLTLWNMTFGIFFDKKYRARYINISRPVYRVYGCCMLLKNSVMQVIDGMDESTFLYNEENILAERMLKNNYFFFYNAEVSIKHNHGASQRGMSTEQKKRIRLIRQRSSEIYLKKYRHFNSFEIWLCNCVRYLIDLIR